MEQIAKTVGILCVSVIAADIFCNTGYFPATEKIIKFVVAVYIILTGFKTVNSIDIKPDFKLPEYQYTYEYQSEFNYAVIAETEKITEGMIIKKLSEKNISYNHVSVHILEQNDILFTDTIVIGCEDRYVSTVKECIEEFITEDTKLIIGE